MAIVEGEGQPNSDLVVDGDIRVRDSSGTTRIRLDSETGEIFVHNGDGDVVFQWQMPGNNLRFGGHGRDGDLVMFRQSADPFSNASNATFHLDSGAGQARIGGGESDGVLVVSDSAGEPRIVADAEGANLRCGGGGGGGGDGDLLLFPSSADISDDETASIRLTANGANISCGGGRSGGDDGDLLLFPQDVDISNTDEASIHLNGANGAARVRSIEFSDGTSQTTAPQTGLISGVSAGDGLSGGGSTGDVQLSISPGFSQAVQNLGIRVQELESQVSALQFQLTLLSQSTPG